MDKKQFNNLLNNSNFLSLFYLAKEKSELDNLPLEGCFMEIGLNKYKTIFPKICLAWGIDNLGKIKQFYVQVRLL